MTEPGSRGAAQLRLIAWTRSRAWLPSCNFAPLRLHLEKRPWAPFLGSQARELRGRAMAARKFCSARAGGRWGGARGNARVIAVPFPPSLLVICSPSRPLFPILELALALFLSAFNSVSCCLVAEFLIVVAGEQTFLPLNSDPCCSVADLGVLPLFLTRRIVARFVGVLRQIL